MPATVNANKLSLTHASSSGINMIFPDVCKTPTPGGPIPIPYPNIAQSSDTTSGSTTVKVDGNPIMLKSSNYKMSTGDEAGSAMGVVSNKIKGKAEPINYSFDVKVDGGNVFRLTDLMLQNAGSPANTPTGSNIQPPVLGKTLSIKECEKTQEKAREQSDKGTSWGNSGVIGAHKGPIQDGASAFNAVLYIRQTKAECGSWISEGHLPKPHSCMNGTTIMDPSKHVPKSPEQYKSAADFKKADDKHKGAIKAVGKVQNFLNAYHADGGRYIPPRGNNNGYAYDASDYMGVIGVDIGNDMIRPERGAGSQTVTYDRKWMTGDYDLFEVLILGRNCDKVAGDRFASLKKFINQGCNLDVIQHPPQAQWVPNAKEQAEGVTAMNMNHLVRDVCRGSIPPTHAVKWHPARGPMAVIDKPLTVVSGHGTVTLDDEEAVKDALVCQECNK